MKVTAQLYGQFLVSSQVNYTGTYLADYLDGLTHDNVGYFLKTSHFTPRQLWQQVWPQVVLSTQGYVLFDDTVLDKHHRRRIELALPPVKRQRLRRNCRHRPVQLRVRQSRNRLILAHRLPPLCPRRGRQDQTRPCGRDAGAVGPARHCLPARCSWTTGTPPRPCSSGCWPPAKPFTAR